MKRTVLLAGFLIVAVILLAGAWIAVPQVLGSESSSAELLSGTSFRATAADLRSCYLAPPTRAIAIVFLRCCYLAPPTRAIAVVLSAVLLSGTSYKGNRDSFSADLLSGTSFKGNRLAGPGRIRFRTWHDPFAIIHIPCHYPGASRCRVFFYPKPEGEAMLLVQFCAIIGLWAVSVRPHPTISIPEPCISTRPASCGCAPKKP